MCNVECIVKPSIVKASLPIDSDDTFLLYNHNNPWIISFKVKVLSILAPLISFF
jgi:hypothetical protein